MTANQIAYWKQKEEARHNAATEYEARRSNKAKEEENYRSNVARENETYRHNFVSEQQNLFGLETQAGHYSQADLAALQSAGAAGLAAQAQMANADTRQQELDFAKQQEDNAMERYYGNLRYNYYVADINDVNTDQKLIQNYVETGAKAVTDTLNMLGRFGLFGSSNGSNGNNKNNSGGGSTTTNASDYYNVEKAFGKVFGVGNSGSLSTGGLIIPTMPSMLFN